MYNLEEFYGPNAGYVLDLYDRYQQDPSSVDEATRAFFASWVPSSVSQGVQEQRISAQEPVSEGSAVSAESQLPVAHLVGASALAHALRERGHLAAHLDPLKSEPLGDPALQPETHGLTDADLAALPASVIGGHAAEQAANALEAIQNLRAMYSGTISYEFDQVKSADERQWLRDAVGLRRFQQELGTNEARELLLSLTKVEAFERYLHQTFVGQKRFSIEGTDTLVPMLSEIMKGALESETQEVIIGMAHRGRLSVLTSILGKPYAKVLAEFSHAKHEAGMPLTDSYGYGWTGDVKYHLGAEQVLGREREVQLTVKMAPNPSHLEFVNPVINGMARASQEVRTISGTPFQDVDDTLPIVIHGDAAFPGEGVVAETLNMWHLRGYWVGGTIHIIVNNQLGFTTMPGDSRSTHFASDLAKGFGIPIIHVNADDPVACVTAVRLAHAYRDQFHKDVLIDLVGYRRWGHNEGDEPAYTQPGMYDIIRNHPTVRAIYAKRLNDQQILSEEETEQMLKDAFTYLEKEKQAADRGEVEESPLNGNGAHLNGVHPPTEPVPAVSEEALRRYNSELLNWPSDFEANPKLARIIQRRGPALDNANGVDWGHAETLAFASILAEGTPIRLTGQDAERATFNFRHAVLHGTDDSTYTPLQHLPEAKATFSVYNSPLCETAVLGFEYGYGVRAPESLVIWEAQYGDFANVGQVLIDQFIAAGRAKWRQDSSLVMLLPHGYEGAGPEHSSARLERYLQLSAQENWRIVNLSSSGQYYHLLRQQASYLKVYPRPLIVMAPKSLLRHPLAASSLSDLTQGSFQTVLDDKRNLSNRKSVRRVLLASGKMAIDLLGNEKLQQNEEIALVRLEQLYPFPADALKEILASYPQAREIVWIQEEPRNMGAWSFLQPNLNTLLERSQELKVISRPERASPASGFWDVYIAEQEQLIADASSLPQKITGGKHVR